MKTETEAAHILELSRDLLDDIELSRLPVETVLLKATRLARLTGADEVSAWLSFEVTGYNSTDPISLLYMNKTGRWINREEKKGYWGSLSKHEFEIASCKTRIEATKIADGNASIGYLHEVFRLHSTLNDKVRNLVSVRSRVMGLLHSFTAGVYYERHFADLAEGVFESYRKDTDTLIAEKCGALLTKIPSVMTRLKEGDEEAVSQALTTCRRILEAFADAIYPPTKGTLEFGGNTLTLDAGKHQNRINVYISERTSSDGRKQRLRQNLSNLFVRVSAGVHNEVTRDEAYSLFLNVYLFLGEVLQLRKETAAEPGSP